jgi:hypothetical protein
MKLGKIALTSIALLLPAPTNAAFILEGAQEVYNFDASMFDAGSYPSSSNSAGFSFTFANSFATGNLDDPFFYNGHLESGESLRIDFYENIGDSIPFESYLMAEDSAGSSGYIRLWTDWNWVDGGSYFVPWTDLEGSVVFTVLSGEVELFMPSVSITVDGNSYVSNLSVAAVPVPVAVCLFGSGLIGLIGVARRKKS